MWQLFRMTILSKNLVMNLQAHGHLQHLKFLLHMHLLHLRLPCANVQWHSSYPYRFPLLSKTWLVRWCKHYCNYCNFFDYCNYFHQNHLGQGNTYINICFTPASSTCSWSSGKSGLQWWCWPVFEFPWQELTLTWNLCEHFFLFCFNYWCYCIYCNYCAG